MISERVPRPWSQPLQSGYGRGLWQKPVFPAVNYGGSQKKECMGYEISINLAWRELDRLKLPGCTVCFLGEHYQVDVIGRQVKHHPGELADQNEADRTEADQTETVLILHYLIGLAGEEFRPSHEWISFKETEGGKLFWPALEKRAIKPLALRFQQDPEGLLLALQEKLVARRVDGADVAIEVIAFPDICIRMLFWNGEGELPAAMSMLFDRALTGVYCTEDVAALLLLIAEIVIID